MNTKLTLSINKSIIEKAKTYAKENNVSISFLVENYFKKLTTDDLPKSIDNQPSIVDELIGIAKIDEDFDYKTAHSDYLIEKYK